MRNQAVMTLVFVLAWSAICVANPDPQTIARLRSEGESHLAAGRFSQARDAFARMATACSDDPVCTAAAQFYLGRTSLEMGRFDDALRLLALAEKTFRVARSTKEIGTVLYTKGRVYAARGDYSEALQHYADAEKIFGGMARPPAREFGLVYANKAIALKDLCRFDESRHALAKARGLLKTSFPAGLPELDLCEARIGASTQDYDAALALYRKVLSEFEGAGNKHRMSQVINDMGHLFEARSEYREAESHYVRAAALAQEAGDRAGLATALNNLGSVRWKQGDYQSARTETERALGIRDELGQRLMRAETLNNLAMVVLAQGDYQGALARLNDAYAIFQEVGSKRGSANAMHNMSLVLRDKGDFPTALTFSQQTAELAEEIQDRRLLATAWLRLGNLHEYFGDFDKAFSLYDKAAGLQRDIHDLFFLGNTLADMAISRTRRARDRDLALAEQNLQEAVAVKKRIGAPSVEVLCKSALFFLEKHAYARSESGPTGRDLEHAAKFLDEAATQVKPTNVNDLMLLSYVKARFLRDTRPEEAKEQFLRLAAQAKQSGSLKFLFLAHVGLGLVHERLNRPREAADAYQQAVKYAEDIRETLEPESRLRFLEGEELLGVRHVLPYKGLARVRMRLGNAYDALKAAEHTKARSFSDRLTPSVPVGKWAVDRGVLEDLTRTEGELRHNYTQLTQARALEGKHVLVPSLEQTRGRLKERKAKILQTITARDPHFAQVRLARTGGLKEAALRDDEWALLYEVTDSATLIFLTRGREVVASFTQPVRSETIRALVQDLRRPFDVAGPDGALHPERYDESNLRAGHELFRLLVSPVLDNLPEGVPLNVIPDEHLGLVPFEMLVMNSDAKVVPGEFLPRIDGARFFGDRNPLVYSQSLTALTLLRARKAGRTAGNRFLVIADPIIQCRNVSHKDISLERRAQIKADLITLGAAGPGTPKAPALTYLSQDQCRLVEEGFSELGETGELARELANLAQGQAEVYTRDGASLERFEQRIAPNLAQFGTIVFATHGILNEVPGVGEPALLLSTVPAGANSWLKMSRIADLNMSADIVALVACKTGLGERISGEGTMGMGRAFHLAGAKAVLMTLWSVDVHASSALVKAFFTNLALGRDRLAALHEARRSVRTLERGTYDHPFFWAGFTLAGDVD
ncbi:MAG: CHAT domain-containing protein [Thermodesulfobacteriota bacterium]